MMKRVVLIVTMCLLLGCGYRFTLQETRKGPERLKTSAISRSIQKIYIAPFINRTPKRGLENLLVNALVYKFNTGQGVEVVSKQEAEAFLSGEILSYETTGVAYTQGKYTATGRVVIVLKARVEDKNGILLWENPQLSDQEDFQIGSNAAQTEDNRNTAIRRILQRIAEQVYEELIVM
ncbi:MAG: hypothetical protein J7M03_04160 [Candidatus Desulfofervidaceae bacterium]|nr:hypothetical protein [Candidatus Desulfofervidaceae bacterium]